MVKILFFKDFDDLIGDIVAAREIDNSGGNFLSKYSNSLLNALSLILTNKAELYDDPVRKSIFLLNNYNFILKKLDNGKKLLEVSERNSPEVRDSFASLVENSRVDFLKFWDEVIKYTGIV